MMNSPLGQYAAPAAALVTVGTVAAYILALLFQHTLAIDPAALSSMHDLAILAFGAIVGSAVAVNGWKQPLVAAHNRLDTQAAQIASLGTIMVETHPPSAAVVSEILAPTSPS